MKTTVVKTDAVINNQNGWNLKYMVLDRSDRIESGYFVIHPDFYPYYKHFGYFPEKVKIIVFGGEISTLSDGMTLVSSEGTGDNVINTYNFNIREFLGNTNVNSVKVYIPSFRITGKISKLMLEDSGYNKWFLESRFATQTEIGDAQFMHYCLDIPDVTEEVMANSDNYYRGIWRSTDLGVFYKCKLNVSKEKLFELLRTTNTFTFSEISYPNRLDWREVMANLNYQTNSTFGASIRVNLFSIVDIPGYDSDACDEVINYMINELNVQNFRIRLQLRGGYAWEVVVAEGIVTSKEELTT